MMALLNKNEKNFQDYLNRFNRDNNRGNLKLGYGLAPEGGVWRETTINGIGFKFSVYMKDCTEEQYYEFKNMFKKNGWTKRCCGLYNDTDDCECCKDGFVDFMKCERYTTHTNEFIGP